MKTLSEIEVLVEGQKQIREQVKEEVVEKTLESIKQTEDKMVEASAASTEALCSGFSTGLPGPLCTRALAEPPV